MNDIGQSPRAPGETRTARPSLQDIQTQVLDLTAEHIGVARDRITLDSRLVDDLGVESIDMVEWIMGIEEHFSLTLPEPADAGDLVYKEVFTRAGFTVGDMAELVHLRWENPPPPERPDMGQSHSPRLRSSFSQMGGVLESRPSKLYRTLGQTKQGLERYRRMTDGMTCVGLPGGVVEIGCEDPDAGADERPLHGVKLAPFLMDEEVVSTTDYCRFLNSIGPIDEDTLYTWFLLPKDERRTTQQLIRRDRTGWVPHDGTAEWPMVLVSWHGANAYSLWANDEDWRSWTEARGAYLPSEAVWEYGARGAAPRRWPWGNRDPLDGEINAGIHIRMGRYRGPTDLPLVPVHALSGVSPFGLLQMAGNVWQWCRDWYDPDAYEKVSNGEAPAGETAVRSERGGSWVGPVSLARSSYRRGRPPSARGRCLGFRCIGRDPG